jgi:hypothetical protein
MDLSVLESYEFCLVTSSHACRNHFKFWPETPVL